MSGVVLEVHIVERCVETHIGFGDLGNHKVLHSKNYAYTTFAYSQIDLEYISSNSGPRTTLRRLWELPPDHKLPGFSEVPERL